MEFSISSKGVSFPRQLVLDAEAVLARLDRVEVLPSAEGALLRVVWWPDAERAIEELRKTLSFEVEVSEPRVVYRWEGESRLEPVMKVRAIIPEDCMPEDCMGDLIASLNQRRGVVVNIDVDTAGGQIVSSLVPLSELFDFPSEFRRMTGGEGKVQVDFHRYEIAPNGEDPDPDEPASAALAA